MNSRTSHLIHKRVCMFYSCPVIKFDHFSFSLQSETVLYRARLHLKGVDGPPISVGTAKPFLVLTPCPLPLNPYTFIANELKLLLTNCEPAQEMRTQKTPGEFCWLDREHTATSSFNAVNHFEFILCFHLKISVKYSTVTCRFFSAPNLLVKGRKQVWLFLCSSA